MELEGHIEVFSFEANMPAKWFDLGDENEPDTAYHKKAAVNMSMIDNYYI